MPTRYAEKVSTGDEVLVSESNKLTPAKVTNVSSLKMQGDYICFFVLLCCEFNMDVTVNITSYKQLTFSNYNLTINFCTLYLKK